MLDFSPTIAHGGGWKWDLSGGGYHTTHPLLGKEFWVSRKGQRQPSFKGLELGGEQLRIYKKTCNHPDSFCLESQLQLLQHKSSRQSTTIFFFGFWKQAWILLVVNVLSAPKFQGCRCRSSCISPCLCGLLRFNAKQTFMSAIVFWGKFREKNKVLTDNVGAGFRNSERNPPTSGVSKNQTPTVLIIQKLITLLDKFSHSLPTPGHLSGNCNIVSYSLGYFAGSLMTACFDQMKSTPLIQSADSLQKVFENPRPCKNGRPQAALEEAWQRECLF